MEFVEPLDLGVRWCVEGRLNGVAVVLAANGAGRDRAADAVARCCARFPFRAVVSTGWCGGLDPALAPAQVVVADRVLSIEPPGEFAARLPAGAPARGSVITVNRIVQTAAEKQALARSTGAVAVEMEAAGVAAEAQRRSLAFYCVRAVSDVAGESLPLDLNRAWRSDGSFSSGEVLRQAALSPTRWLEIYRLWGAARQAAHALGEYLGGCRFEA